MESLRSSPFDSLFRNHPDAVIVTDLNGAYLDMNDSCVRLTGYGTEDARPASLREMVDGASVPVLSLQLASIARGASGRFAAELLTEDGRRIEVKMTAVPMTDDSGGVVGAFWIAKAVPSDEKRPEELFRLISACTNDIISYISHEGDLVYVNHAVHRTLGYDPERLVGAKFFELLHPDDYAHLKRQDRTKDTDLFVYRIRHRDGYYLWFETVIQRIKDPSGNDLYSVNISREMTERKRLEDELLSTKEMMESFIDNHADMMLLFRRDDTVARVNPAFVRQTGWAPEDVLGQSAAAVAFMTEELRGRVLADVGRLRDGLDVPGRESLVRCKSGRSLDVFATLSPIRDAGGLVDGWSMVLRDISERKRTEELLIRSEKLAVAGELAAGIGHEIRNPLTTLKGFVQLLPRHPDKQPDYLEVMRTELDRIDLICSELLLLAKPQAVSYKDADLNALLDEVLALLQPQAALCDVRIASRLADAPPIVRCDTNQVKQVFINLLKNAIESMPDGGKASVFVRKSAEDVTVRIEDEGCGISEERLHKIGEPFYSTKDKGTGLGMLVSYKIVESHRGRIRIESKVNEGTRVQVTFPLADKPREAVFE
ncbi:PAS domain S-box protein [Paenibacillus sp.]|uniref:PAS domain S-box protein n=1 Tax=Paenibacillus sp. TaxID=58172 RepID=UPI0028118886|nr:PAS domain S-box protein [Paenibacillus sp.]